MVKNSELEEAAETFAATATPQATDLTRRAKQYTFVYFLANGAVITEKTAEPIERYFERAYMVMCAHSDENGHQAPFVEIIKSRFGPASLICTADMQAECGKHVNEGK